MSKLIEHAITNLQSAKAVIQHLKKENPALKEVTVPDHVKAQINEDLTALSNELGVMIPQQSPIHGVRIVSEFERKGVVEMESTYEHIRKLELSRRTPQYKIRFMDLFS